jgi:hypothetical protein
MLLRDILKIEGIEAGDRNARVTLCRHYANKSKDLDAAIQRDPNLLNAYQSEQGDDSFFKRSGLILSFLPDSGRRAVFVGAYRNEGRINVPEYLKLFPGNPVGQFKGYEVVGSTEHFYYRLTAAPLLQPYQRRLVIDWGGSTRKWCQFKLDKPVVELYPPGYVAPFVDYYDVLLTFDELKAVVKHEDGNRLWHVKLKSIAAVYLITDLADGQQYVGAAYGQDGLFGRWRSYVKSGGHGGNDKLVERLQQKPDAARKFQFSILRVLDKNSTKEQVVAVERMMMQKLGSRAWGLNH